MSTENKQHKPAIGLIGAIGSGKSLVARQLASLGCAVIDADELAKSAINQPIVRDELIRWWGQKIIDPTGKIDRRAVGRIVFNEPQQLHRLEALVHPLVHQARQQLRRQFQQNDSIVAIVEDCPLLLEKKIDDQCDTIIFVDTSLQNRLRRIASARDWSEEDLAHRENFQLGLDIKANRADYIIDNNGDEGECLLQVRRVLSQILQAPP